MFGSRSKSDALTRDVSADLRENTEQEACEQTQFIIQVKSGSRRSAEGLFTHMYRHKPAILTARRPARRLTLGQHDKRTRRRGDELKLSLFTTQMKAAVRRPGQTGGNAELQQEADEPARTHTDGFKVCMEVSRVTSETRDWGHQTRDQSVTSSSRWKRVVLVYIFTW